MHSVYSNKVFQINTSSLTLKSTKELRSKYTTIGAKKISTTGKTMKEVLAQRRKHWETGYISAHFYNPYLMHHYLVVAKENEEGFYEENGYIPWVLLICDKAFNTLKEVNFDDHQYSPFLMATENGFLLQKTNVKVNDYKKQKLVFHEMEY